MQDVFLDKVDNATNKIMDELRMCFGIKEDSDQDDELYGFIHASILQEFKQVKPEMIGKLTSEAQ